MEGLKKTAAESSCLRGSFHSHIQLFHYPTRHPPLEGFSNDRVAPLRKPRPWLKMVRSRHFLLPHYSPLHCALLAPQCSLLPLPLLPPKAARLLPTNGEWHLMTSKLGTNYTEVIKCHSPFVGRSLAA